MKKRVSLVPGLIVAACLAFGGVVHADNDHGNGQGNACRDLPSHAALRAALSAAQGQANGGFGLEMWASVVNRDGIVCAVAFTRRQPRRSVAGQPRDLGAEGQHRQRVQPAGPGALHRQPLLRGAAGREPVRPAGEQSREHRVAYGGNPANYGQATIRWWAGASAA